MKRVIYYLGSISLALFLTLSSASFFGGRVFAKDNVQTQKVCIKADGYTLECGKYKGYETDYNHETKKPFKKLVTAEIGKNKITINGITTKLKVKGNKLYIKKTEMYELIGNNKLLMLAGGGIVFEHE